MRSRQVLAKFRRETEEVSFSASHPAAMGARGDLIGDDDFVIMTIL
jgi:hypothetical protein